MDFLGVTETALLWVFIQHRKHSPSRFSRGTGVSGITVMALPWAIPKRCIRTAQKTRSVWIFPRQAFSRYHSDGASLGCPQLMHSYSIDITLGRGFPWAIGSNRIEKRGFSLSYERSNLGSYSPTATPRAEGNRVTFFRHQMPDFLNIKINSFPGGFSLNRNTSFVFSIVLWRAILQEVKRTDRWNFDLKNRTICVQ
jgi:hypothetical protein